MRKKRRTPAQIRATKKLVALNKVRSRGNPKRKSLLSRFKDSRKLKRGHKATAKWVRAGMPSQRNANPKGSGPMAQRNYIGESYHRTLKAARSAAKRLTKRDGSTVYINAYADSGKSQYEVSKRYGPRNLETIEPKWVRAGMPSQRNTKNKLQTGRKYDVNSLTFIGWTIGDGTSTDGYNAFDYFTPDGSYLGPDEHGIEPLYRRPLKSTRNPKGGGSGRVISGYGSTIMNPGPKLTMAQGKKLYELGRRSPKKPVAMKPNGRGVTIVTGKAVRKLKRR